MGYRNIIGQNLLLRESWHKISLKGRDIGYVFTSTAGESTDSGAAVDINSKIHINLGLPVRSDDIILDTYVRLDSSFRILNLRSDFSAPGASVINTLEAISDGKYQLHSISGGKIGSARTETVSIPDSAVVFIPPVDLLPPRLHTGVRAYMRALDPLTISPSAVEVETVLPGKGIGQGLAKNLHWTRLQYRGLDFLCARNESNDTVMVQAPLGIMLKRCSAEEALKAAGLAEADSIAADLSPEKITQYVESLIGPLSSVIKLNPETDTASNDKH